MDCGVGVCLFVNVGEHSPHEALLPTCKSDRFWHAEYCVLCLITVVDIFENHTLWQSLSADVLWCVSCMLQYDTMPITCLIRMCMANYTMPIS